MALASIYNLPLIMCGMLQNGDFKNTPASIF